MTAADNAIRYDLRLVASWIPHGARVLGLGCGDGALLDYLKTRKKAVCTGIDIDEDKVAHCIERGLTVLQGDINEEVRDYPDNAFDFVILAQTLQQTLAGPADAGLDRTRTGDAAAALPVARYPQYPGDHPVRLQAIRPAGGIQYHKRGGHQYGPAGPLRQDGAVLAGSVCHVRPVSDRQEGIMKIVFIATLW